MKNIITSLLILLCFTAKAQDTCPALQAFDGEWRYVNGQDTIRMYFRYHECNFPVDGKTDIIPGLWGWHEYKRGNTIVESNYSNRFMNLPGVFDYVPSRSFSILLQMFNCDTSRGKLIGFIDDLSQPLLGITVNIQYNNAKTEIQWHQTTSKPTALPNYFTLTKQ